MSSLADAFGAYAAHLANAALGISNNDPGSSIVLLTQSIDFIIQGMSQEQILALPTVTSEVVAFIQSQIARHEQGKVPS